MDETDMPNSGGLRQIISSALVAGGVVVLIYGVFFHAAVIAPAGDDAAMVSATRETSLIREVVIGGLERDESGEIKKTYTGQAPKACPT